MKQKNEEILLDDNGRPLKMAEKLGKEVTDKDIKDVEDKLPSMKKGPVAKIWDKVMDIYHGFMSEDTPGSMKVLLIGALVYLILPTDVVPDFIPGVGLLDDVGVVTFIWQKLKKISDFTQFVKLPEGDEKPNSILKKVQDRIKEAYEKAFLIARDQLDTAIKKKARQTIYNSFISLGIFLAAIILIATKDESLITIASILILYLFVRSLVKFIKILPTSIKFIKCYFKTKNVDKAISQYLKDRYTYIETLEGLKNKLKVLDDVPDLDIIINMQRKSLKRTIITVVATIVLIMVLFFVVRHSLLLKTSYTFVSIIVLPFQHLYNLIAG